MISNRGMYAEEMFNRTIEYYASHNIALIEKRAVPIKIIKDINPTSIVGKLLNKSLVDYCGCYLGRHLEFEVKETSQKQLSLGIIQPHQFDYLTTIVAQKGLAYLMVYFSIYETFYLIPFDQIINYVKTSKSRTIPYAYVQKNFIKLEIIYPGIIDFIGHIKQTIQ
jgi:recombination protein U